MRRQYTRVRVDRVKSQEVFKISLLTCGPDILKPFCFEPEGLSGANTLSAPYSNIKTPPNVDIPVSILHTPLQPGRTSRRGTQLTAEY